MGGRNIIHKKKLLLFGAVIIAFFVFVEPLFGSKIYAFGHPDVTALDVEFVSPNAGSPLRPDFKVRYKINDTTPNDIGGDPQFGALHTKNGDLGWIGRGGIESFQETFIKQEWCNVEGTNTCGVRIRASDTASHITQAERFFTIDTTPPQIAISSNSSDPTQKTDASFRFSASDAYGVDRIECALDEQPFGVCESPKEYKNIFPGGRHVFKVRARDKAGNSAEKTLEWTIDSTPPTVISGLSGAGPTYFSGNLNWASPEEFARLLSKIIPASRYDIRYSREPITEENWNETTAIIHNEPIPKAPGSPESMRVGPENDRGEDFKNLRLGDISNILSANIKHYFAIKSRDDNWNWSKIQQIAPSFWTNRDPCDYDADRLYSPKSGCGPKVCNPNLESCDLYDNPYGWGLPGDWPYDKRDEEWIRTFGATSNDLDQDGEGVAAARIGVNQTTKEEITGYPKQAGTDWYDNPFTLDFFELFLRPALKQLSDTINDLDLDTFVSGDWKNTFGGDAGEEPTSYDISGLIYPGAAENTCFNCTAYSPDPATGRIPPGKIQATTNENRAVGQVEAYYADLPIGQYEVIKQGTIDKKRPTIAASAQCRDGLNNDLQSGTDSSEDARDPNREINCPTKFEIIKNTSPSSEFTPSASVLKAAIFPDVGLVQCGRNADDYRTPVDESANCNICHFFYTIFTIKNLVISRLMPFIVALAIVAGGLMIALSRGSVDTYQRGKKTIVLAISAYALTLLVWTLISLFFILIGSAKWTGLTHKDGEISGGWWTFTCELGGKVIADFSASPDSGVAPFEVRFTDLSLGEKIISWQWNFGDGGTSADQSPGHTYTTNGPHTVTLLVLAQDGASGKKTKTIHYAPTADFAADKTHGRSPHKVRFQDKSTGEIERWSWDFDGDNREDSSEKNPQYTYAVPGPYRVKLTVFGPGGQDLPAGMQDTESKVSYIFAYPKPIQPIASFSASAVPDPPSGLLTAVTENSSFLSFLLRFSSDLNPLNPNDHFSGWKWDFGDGLGTSAVENPKYFYDSSAEPYTITLTALGPGGEHSTTTTIAFPPQANFSSDKTSGIVPLTTRFHDTSIGTVSSLSWNFGDGSSPLTAQLGQTVSHIYDQNGEYAIKLNAEGPEGESEKFVEGYIKVAPRADFSTDTCSSSLGCPLGTSVNFTNSSNCRENCSWYWEFGDGETSSEPEPKYAYKQNDIYTVRLTVTGIGGSHTAEKNNYIRVSPRAEFFANPTSYMHGCGSDPCPDPGLLDVTFSDSSQGIITDLSLDFGDGSIQKITKGGTISHSYPLGPYTATLTATDHNGLQSTDSVNININQAPPPEPPPAPKPQIEGRQETLEAVQKIISNVFERVNEFSSREIADRTAEAFSNWFDSIFGR